MGRESTSFLGLWPKAKSAAGDTRAKAGAAPAAADDTAEYVTSEQLDEKLSGMRDEITAGFDEIKSMIGGGEDDDDASAEGDEDEPEAAASEDEIKAAVPSAPESFRKAAVAAGLTLTMVRTMYDSAGKAAAATTLGTNRPPASARRSTAPAAAKGTAAGFRARCSAFAAELVQKDGIPEDRAMGKAVAKFAASDPAGYNAYQAEEQQAFTKKRLGLVS